MTHMRWERLAWGSAGLGVLALAAFVACGDDRASPPAVDAGADALPGDRGRGNRRQALRPKAREQIRETQALEVLRAVHQEVAVGTQPREQVHLVQEGRVADDERVGFGDRLPEANRPVVYPAEGDHRGAHPLRAEAGERLRMRPVVEGGGSCGLENLRTLCWECHRKVTRELAVRRGRIRAA